MITSNIVGRRAICLALLVLCARVWADCPPTAVTDGDPALVASLATRLSAIGIATSPAPGCPAVRVTVQQRGPQLHLHLADAFQRQSERDVVDVATAVAIVESWTTQVVEEGALPAEPTAPSVASEPPPPRSAYRGASLAATSALGTDGTTWVGAALGACTRAGPLCVGGSLRGELDTTATGTSSTVSQDSYTLAAYATADLPRGLSETWVVSPGAGAGYGFEHVVTHHHDAMNNPLDVPFSDHELRLAAHVAVLHAIAAHWSAFADLWGDAGVLRSDSQFGPTASLRLSLGLRLEGR